MLLMREISLPPDWLSSVTTRDAVLIKHTCEYVIINIHTQSLFITI